MIMAEGLCVITIEESLSAHDDDDDDFRRDITMPR